DTRSRSIRRHFAPGGCRVRLSAVNFRVRIAYHFATRDPPEEQAAWFAATIADAGGRSAPAPRADPGSTMVWTVLTRTRCPRRYRAARASSACSPRWHRAGRPAAPPPARPGMGAGPRGPGPAGPAPGGGRPRGRPRPGRPRPPATRAAPAPPLMRRGLDPDVTPRADPPGLFSGHRVPN